MRWGLIVCAGLALAACTASAPARLIEARDERGFTIRYPQTWTQVRRDDAAWFVPDADRVPDVAEFILVVTRSAPGKLDDPTIRRVVFEVLPVQGVSGFQQDARTTAQALWYKFEVTGTSAGREWASVGVLVSGDVRYHIAVCAKPLQQWRSGQKQCDEVIRTFQPGNLNR